MPVIKDCTAGGITGILVPLLMLVLLARVLWGLARKEPVGLGADRALSTAERGGVAGVVATALLLLGWASIAVSRFVYVFGNPGGPEPEAVFIGLSLAMLVPLGLFAWPLARGRSYTHRGAWYALAGLSAFLAFFALVDLPCGTAAASWVFYGIDAAMAGAVLRIWAGMGR